MPALNCGTLKLALEPNRIDHELPFDFSDVRMRHLLGLALLCHDNFWKRSQTDSSESNQRDDIVG